MTATTVRVLFEGPALAASRAYCRDLTKREARNFYYGLKLLPEEKRAAMYSLYAYMRLVDDIASRIFEAGAHSLRYDGNNQASGMYVVRMTSGEYTQAQKVMLLK